MLSCWRSYEKDGGSTKQYLLVGVHMGMSNKAIFIPATSFPTWFSLKTKLLTTISPNTLLKCKGEPTDLHKTL